jgi:hypothetical protein
LTISGIIFNDIFITESKAHSGVFVGKNSASGWKVHRKRQSGLNLPDNSYVSDSTFVLQDRDVIDMLISR